VPKMMMMAPGQAHKAHSRDLKNDANIEFTLIVMNCGADTETPLFMVSLISVIYYIVCL